MATTLPWPLAMVLILLAFALPFLLFAANLRKERKLAESQQTELNQLRNHILLLEEQAERDKGNFLNAVAIPFLLLRPSGRIIAANKAAQDLFKLDARVPNTNLLEHLDAGPLHQALALILRGKSMQTQKVRLNMHGADLVFRLLSTSLDNHHGEPLVGIAFRDITEEQRTLTIRRDFVANASHELRTPLTIIRGYLETLIEDPEQAEDPVMRQRALGLMKKHSDRIVRLVEDMLAISRLERADKAHLRMEEFSMESVISDVNLRLDSTLRAKGNRLHVDIKPLPFLMYGDRFYWEQVFFNLIENAIKNNPEGEIRISVKARIAENGTAIVQVEDNGRGIKSESLPYIFKRFFRADSTGMVKGTGLGLSIVRNAVEAHGGSISAESVAQEYTRFTINTPLRASIDE